MKPRRFISVFHLLSAVLAAAPTAWAQNPVFDGSRHSITDHRVHSPTPDRIAAALTLRDYNTRVVVIGVTLLGLASGLIGSFMLLRKRSLIGDVLSHATLPGIGLAFISMTVLGGDGKWMPGLLAGATLSGVAGVLCILAIVHLTRIKEDAALGIVLSVFFAAGVAVTGVIQNMETGHAAGLKSFIYGKTASMLWNDAVAIGAAALAAAALCTLLFKEFTLLCFDASFAATQGRSVLFLDTLLMAAVVVVAVIGLQAVGLILMVAMLVIPAAAARFWTNHLPTMLAAAGAIGAAGGYIGAALSALSPRLPAGAIIVLASGAMFGLSLLFGPARGLAARLIAHSRLARRVARQHLLRAFHELSEHLPPADVDSPPITVDFHRLLESRSWSASVLRRELRRAQRDHLVRSLDRHRWSLTTEGLTAARRVTRNHRLWELFLITHADIAPSHVDRDADQVEHVLDPTLVRSLESALAAEHPDLVAPQSPHLIESRAPASRRPA